MPSSWNKVTAASRVDTSLETSHGSQQRRHTSQETVTAASKGGTPARRKVTAGSGVKQHPAEESRQASTAKKTAKIILQRGRTTLQISTARYKD
jgi:hypothetical protein